MRTHSKTLNPADFKFLEGNDIHVQNVVNVLGKAHYRFEHPNRAWEYGLALKVLRENDVKTVLDVGGGGSVFAPAASWVGMEVTQVDPGDVTSWIAEQNRVLVQHEKGALTYEQMDFFNYSSRKKFDAVTCLSTIEHVVDDKKFFLKLLSLVKKGGLLILTTDFHPTAKVQVDGHLRTYNKRSMHDFIEWAMPKGFVPYDASTDYDFFEENVNNYTFASLILINQAKTDKISKNKYY